MTRSIHTYCRVFGNGALTTRLNDMDNDIKFEHPTFNCRRERSNRLRHRRGDGCM